MKGIILAIVLAFVGNQVIDHLEAQVTQHNERNHAALMAAN